MSERVEIRKIRFVETVAWVVVDFVVVKSLGYQGTHLSRDVSSCDVLTIVTTIGRTIGRDILANGNELGKRDLRIVCVYAGLGGLSGCVGKGCVPG